MVYIGNSWDELLKDVLSSKTYLELREFLKSEYSKYKIYPDMHDIFNALKATDYNAVKAVIIGQDPYHGPGQAHGFCFSVKEGVPAPPSLSNIFKEIKDDLGIECASPCLQKWAERGVLLLNAVLTVREGLANSHRGRGWESVTDCVITKLNERETPVVFLLWGSFARAKKELITNPKHLILEAAHPSPLSAHNSFFGSRHFSKANKFLSERGIEPIDWST
ncbi:MAG: uracil-DNA glycosylase [Clostridiales bacterium]|nr:uracil-DNA glycosylase [Clostridiales bacterium]